MGSTRSPSLLILSADGATSVKVDTTAPRQADDLADYFCPGRRRRPAREVREKVVVALLKRGAPKKTNPLMTPTTRLWPIPALFPFVASLSLWGGEPASTSVNVSWDRTTLVSRTTPTLQVVVNPMLRQGSPIHDGAFSALKDLHASHVRYVPWFPYPRLVVAELDAPTATGTSWDFSLIDPMTRDFMGATRASRPS